MPMMLEATLPSIGFQNRVLRMCATRLQSLVRSRAKAQQIRRQQMRAMARQVE